MPYNITGINLSDDALRDANMWSACVPLICFSIIEWHQSDRVKIQFGIIQDIPGSPENLDKLHKADKRGNSEKNWTEVHASWIQIWRDRYNRIVEGPSIQDPIMQTQEYMNWFLTNSRPYLSAEQYLQDPRDRAMSPASHFTPQQHTTSQNPIPQHPTPYSTTPVGAMSFGHTTPSQQNFGDNFASRHSFASTSTGTDNYSNIFGANFGTPVSASTYLQNLSSFQHITASTSQLPELNFNQGILEEDLPVETNNEEQSDEGRRQRPQRNRRPRRCGTGHHLGG